MDAELQDICEQVVSSWKKQINPPELSSYVKNTLDMYMDNAVKQAVIAEANRAIEISLDERRKEIEKIVDQRLGDWVIGAVRQDLHIARNSSRRSAEKPSEPKILIAVHRMKISGMSGAQIAGAFGITTMAAESLIESAEEQVTKLRAQLAVYEVPLNT